MIYGYKSQELQQIESPAFYGINLIKYIKWKKYVKWVQFANYFLLKDDHDDIVLTPARLLRI